MMNKRMILSALIVMVMLAAIRCKDDDAPKTEPVVKTSDATLVTTTTATFNGEITSNGNDGITKTGFVYSASVANPTLADDKVELSDLEGMFNAPVTGLKSGSTYHVRAYATNSVGTGYGEVVDVITGNSAPVANNVNITGDALIDGTLAGNYTYVDSEGDAESGSTYQWYRLTSATDAGTAIDGATSLTYVIKEADKAKYLKFGVTPKASSGVSAGVEVRSGAIGAVGEPTTVSFNYNGLPVTYGILISATTGRKWLDRNLGAGAVPTSSDNYQNYGDLFQWGRLADGHQLITRSGATNADVVMVNGPTSTTEPYQLSSTDNPGTKLFIVNGSGDVNNAIDWRDPQNNNLWQGVSGINNPCPAGWRVPTKAEWVAENFTDLADAYSKLKLTFTGVRTGQTNLIFQTTTQGNYWTSDIGVDNVKQATYIRVNPTAFEQVEQPRANAYCVRCIKN